jgi:LacI family transcriptional regulator
MPRSDCTRITIQDVADLAGVSIATVSRVLNQSEPVAEATAEKVHTAVAQLGFAPHAAARSLASQRTYNLGLVLPAIHGSFFPPMLRGIENEIQQRGYDLLIYTTQQRAAAADNRKPISPVGFHNMDGAIVLADALADKELSRLDDSGFPLVLLHRSPPADRQIPCVTVENKSGARRITAHLIETHHKRHIAFLAGPPGNEDSFWREQGYREALRQYNLPELIGLGEFEEGPASATVSAWLQEGREFDAIFAADDDSALGALQALNQAHIPVPDKIAVVGFDDGEIARYLTPPLTTIRAPIEQAGRHAAAALLDLIVGQSVSPLTLLGVDLVIRRSCGCMPM